MDKSTLVGIIAGVILLGMALFLDAGWQIFFDFPSFLIVMGGTIAATLINFPLNDVMSVIKVTQKVMKHESFSHEDYIEKLVQLSKKAKTKGLLAIEQDLKEIDIDFLKTGLQHVVNGTEVEDLRNILEAELASMAQRHKVGQNIFLAMGTYAPAFGMIGTLIGLIKMLQNLEEPSGIGPGMALAMVTTFYGAILANLFFLPMAGKLKKRSEEEILFKEMLLQGILLVQAEESPRTIKNKLLTYLSPKSRNNGQYFQREVMESERTA